MACEAGGVLLCREDLSSANTILRARRQRRSRCRLWFAADLFLKSLLTLLMAAAETICVLVEVGHALHGYGVFLLLDAS